MAEKNTQYIRVLPQIRLSFEGTVVQYDYNEEYKFATVFLLTSSGLVQFSTNKKYEVNKQAKVQLVCSQYKFNEK